MLKAKTKAGELIMISDYSRKTIDRWRKSRRFYCPACDESVIIKAGTEVVAHFAHQAKSTCRYGTGGEGEYHEQGKYLLYQWLVSQNIQTELEVYLPEIKQRPDILITIHGKKIAIEFQCAKVSNQIIKQRNIGYLKEGIIPIWIIGMKLFQRYNGNTFRCNRFILQFLHQFPQRNITTLFYFCPQTLQFHVVTDVHVTNSRRAIGNINTCNIVTFPFQQLFTSFKLSTKNLLLFWSHQLYNFRTKARGKVSGTALIWRHWLYEREIYIDTLPSFIFLPVRSQYRMKTPLYDWQSRILIDFLRHVEIGTKFTSKEVRSLVDKYIISKENFPLSLNNSHPIDEYLEFLTKFDLLLKVEEGIFEKKQSIPFYTSIHEALIGDRQFFQYINNKLINIMLNQG